MSGHSKWAQIKHKKAGTDAKRGVLFSKLARMITVAARDGGGDPATNIKLRQTAEQAREAGLPKDNIERAILRGTRVGATEELHAVEYEAYGPGGSAFLITGLTDNRNRTTNEIKHILDSHSGRLATSGSVAWLFERKAIATFPATPRDHDRIELALVDSGAEDTQATPTGIQALVHPDVLELFLQQAADRGLRPEHTAFATVAKTLMELDASTRRRAAELTEALEDHNDITEVWANVALEEPLAV